VYAMAQAQHERPSSVDMGDGDCGLKEGSAASPRSAAVAKDVTDIVDIKTAKDIAVKRRQERRQLDVIDEDDALEGEPSSKRRPPPQLAIKRAASTPAEPARTSPPLKKAAFTDFNSVLRRSYSITIEDNMAEKMAEREPSQRYKIINDNIHGHIEIPEVVMLLVDTPQFQRLRRLKQLGTCSYVYPGATHNRFTHSIGVSYLAGKFARELQKQRPELVTDKDVYCVMMAGLCHDLGHGPWSHFWEGFIRTMTGEKWEHEPMSIMMLDHMIKTNDLMPRLRKHGINETDLIFIKELIVGPLDESGMPSKTPSASPEKKWPYQGRTEDKSFLYEIVANKENGIDVDKWDYFLRDQAALKIGVTFQYERFIKNARVMRPDPSSRRRICLRDKEADNLKEMFLDRARLHRHGYQHRVTLTIDVMLMDAIKLADSSIQIKGSGGKMYRMSECQNDIVAYQRLTDSVFERIQECDNRKAVDLLDRILKRDLYKMVAEIKLSPDDQVLKKSNDQICEDIRQRMVGVNGCNGDSAQLPDSVDPNDIFVIRRSVSSGKESENPAREGKVCFYYKNSKGEPAVGPPVHVDLRLPDTALDRTLWVCSRTNDASTRNQAKRAVEEWMEANGLKANLQN